MRSRPVISLLTDFGLRDHYVGAMKGVILGICPDVQLVDVSHEVTPYAIPEGAYKLAQAWECFPRGAVHVAIVDPGVGSARRPIVAEAGGHYFVAPDNGVLTMLYETVPEHAVREITAEQYFRHPISRTFHGRDIFAPVAAHLANGVAMEEIGSPIQDYVKLSFAKPVQTGPNTWSGILLSIDRFGNIITNLPVKEWSNLSTGNFEIRIESTVVRHVVPSYDSAPRGVLFLIAGSSQYWEIALREASAAEALGCKASDTIMLQFLNY
jgi:S-adenosyl-L-methionine hydrolase (adenosine-forming)